MIIDVASVDTLPPRSRCMSLGDEPGVARDNASPGRTKSSLIVGCRVEPSTSGFGQWVGIDKRQNLVPGQEQHLESILRYGLSILSNRCTPIILPSL